MIGAHSLGNMLVSSAICDHGLKAGRYFMFNSAVPREAYHAGYVADDRGNMRHSFWETYTDGEPDPILEPYPNRLWASDWKDLYGNDSEEGVEENDGRKMLTWQDRFRGLKDKTNPFNYYSSGEDVAGGALEGGQPKDFGLAVIGNGAWISQEMNKGIAIKAAVNGFATGNWDAGGGWAFNLNHAPYSQYRSNPLDPPTTLPDTNAITDDQLRANPFFKPFTKLKPILNVGDGAVPDATNGTDITSAAGSAHASEYVIRAWMLAHEIPSLSLPTASGSLEDEQRADIGGIDMETSFKSGQWGDDKWTHSAMVGRDPEQVWKLYKNMCDEGNLRKP